MPQSSLVPARPAQVTQQAELPAQSSKSRLRSSSVLLFVIGFTSILMGLLAEILVRTYFESQGLRAYHIRKLVNLEQVP